MPPPRLQVIVLAAGASRRLGRDKALLSWGRDSLARHVCEQFRGEWLGQMIVVCNALNQNKLRRELWPDVDFVVNPDPTADMLSSVRLGLSSALPAAGPLCVHPVDVFAVVPGLVRLLYDGWVGQPERVHVPTVSGRRAHPVIIPTRFNPAIRALPPGHGLDQLLADFPDQVVEHSWHDERLLCDIDSPEDYERYRPVG